MYGLISVLIVIVSVLLILIVLVQNSKGGGLASNFQSSNQVMGVRRTTDFLEKATWTLAIALLVLSLGASAFIKRSSNANESIIKDQIENTQVPGTNFQFPTSTEEGTGEEEGTEE